MGIEQEGSIAFWMRHPDADWATNDQSYRFNPVEIGPVRAWALKRPDKMVEFHVSGPLKREIVLEGKMPPVDASGLHVVITWSEKQVQLYLNAKPHGIVKLPEPKTGGPADA
jgi:hypothetical protein